MPRAVRIADAVFARDFSSNVTRVNARGFSRKAVALLAETPVEASANTGSFVCLPTAIDFTQCWYSAVNYATNISAARLHAKGLRCGLHYARFTFMSRVKRRARPRGRVGRKEEEEKTG